MVQEAINVGSAANDGTGDTLRAAGNKINNNFTELYNQFGGATLGNVTRLTDSGISIVGSSFITQVGAADPASTINIDFPDSAGNVVVDTATQTLTNKTISADDNTLSGLATSSFILSNASGIIDGAASRKTIPAGVVVGTTDTQSLTNKTLNLPTLKRANVHEWLADSNGHPVISFTDTVNARNRLRIESKASPDSPIISTEGSADTNINLELNPKGAGSVRVSKLAYSSGTISSTSTVAQNISYIQSTATANIVATVDNGLTTGEVKVFTHDGANTTTVTPTNFSQGTSIALSPNDTVMIIWNGSQWSVIGGEGYTIS
jgi:hypothetical protein